MSNLLTDKEKERFNAVQLRNQGKSESHIAKIMKHDIKWVRATFNRFNTLGDFKDKPRSGRPRKMETRDEKRLLKKVKGKQRQSVRKTAASFQTARKEKLGRETIRMTLKRGGLYPHRRRKTTRLSAEQKLRRVKFANKYRRYDWTKCAFWDETEFDLYPTPNIKDDIIWDEKGAEYTYGKEAHPPTFKIGGAITVHGPTRLVPYTGTIDSTKYQDMVDMVVPDIDDMFGGQQWTWVQDGARPHTSRSTMTHLLEHVPDVFPKDDWPPNSPDDNPTENIFGIVDAEVQAKGSTTLRALKVNVQNSWKRLSPELCRKCIEAIPKRLNQIIETGGEYVYEVKGKD